jgi:serine protease
MVSMLSLPNQHFAFAMSKPFLGLLLVTVFISCNRLDDAPVTPKAGTILQLNSTLIQAPGRAAYTRSEVDAIIIDKVAQQGHLDWKDVDLLTQWSAASTNHRIVIGYQPADIQDADKMLHQIDIKSGPWKAVHDALLDRIVALLQSKGQAVTREDIVVEDDPILPILVVNTADIDVITDLNNLKNIRYVEPYGYWPTAWISRSSSGCNGSTDPLNPADWTGITPGCLLPWNYNNLNIPTAWTIAQGQGIRIGVIDAGISSSQNLIGSLFNDGFSGVGRTVTTDFTMGTSTYTSCTHGTSMCSTAAGPRNAQNATTGVAYKSNLHFIRACDDVVLDASAELTGTRNALIKMGDLADIRVVSMSIGTPFSSSALKDGCTYAFNKGKLLLAAAGTSFGVTSWYGVIYPAYYSQCVAVTGVNESGNTCSNCHDGSKVLFTVPMERNVNSGRNSLALQPSTTTPSYIGGSSVATSTSAGIAALIWSVKPTLTSAQVVDIMTRTCVNYPNRNAYRGYGNLNAAAAVTLAQTY